MPPAIKNFIRRDEAVFLLAWCSGYIGAKIGLPFTGTFTLLFYRYVLVVLIVAVFVTWKRQWVKPTAASLIIGFLGHFIWMSTVYKSLELGMSAGAAALIAAMQPALTALLAPALLGEANTKRQWLGIAIGFAGVCIFVSQDVVLGGVAAWIYLLPAAATASLTAVTLLERRGELSATTAPIPIATSLFYQAAITAALLAPLAWWFEGFHAAWTQPVFALSLLWLAVFPTLVAYGVMLHLIRTRDAARVSALQYFVPPVTMLLAYAAFGEELTLYGLLGLAVTAVGFYFLHRTAADHYCKVFVCHK